MIKKEEKEKALKLLEEFKRSRPELFFEKFDLLKQGTHFVLGYLSIHNEEVISSDLSSALNVSSARMAKILKNMEKRGLIEKKQSTSDARKTIVTLTKKGRDLILKYQDIFINSALVIIEKVGEEDLKEFIRISNKIKQAVKENESMIKEIDINNY